MWLWNVISLEWKITTTTSTVDTGEHPFGTEPFVTLDQFQPDHSKIYVVGCNATE